MVIDILLEKAALARTNNFDLLGTDGVQMLRKELIADFPFLTLADVNDTVMRGIKGQLDKLQSRPLNFTRAYQWFEQRAIYSQGFWQMKHPAMMDWAEMNGITKQVLAEINTFLTPVEALTAPHKMRDLLRTVLHRVLTPDLVFDEDGRCDNRADFPDQWRTIMALADLHPTLLTKYPESATAYRQPY